MPVSRGHQPPDRIESIDAIETLPQLVRMTAYPGWDWKFRLGVDLISDVVGFPRRLLVAA